MADFVFITGIARSGTNLIGRMLGQHRDFAVAMDPFLPVLKWFRSSVSAAAMRAGTLPAAAPIPPSAPLDDYYFSEDRLRLMRVLQEAGLGLAVDQERWPALLKDVADRAVHESADLLPHLDALKAPTYAAMWEAGMNLIAKHRGKGSPRWAGVKELWCVEFIPHLLKAFPASKFIMIVRDPRATIASMLKMGEDDPTQQAQILSYARHWRKQAAFACRFRETPSLAQRLMIIRYEDLVADSDRAAREMCRFFGVEFDPAMLNLSEFWDPSRQSTWRGNSSYKTLVSEIDANLARRWESYLTPSQVRLIDFLCGPDMPLLGYQPHACGFPCSEADIPASAFFNSYGAAASWRSDSGDPLLDLGLEVGRRALLRTVDRPSSELIQRCFLFERVYDQLTEFDSVERGETVSD